MAATPPPFGSSSERVLQQLSANPQLLSQIQSLIDLLSPAARGEAPGTRLAADGHRSTRQSRHEAAPPVVPSARLLQHPTAVSSRRLRADGVSSDQPVTGHDVDARAPADKVNACSSSSSCSSSGDDAGAGEGGGTSGASESGSESERGTHGGRLPAAPPRRSGNVATTQPVPQRRPMNTRSVGNAQRHPAAHLRTSPAQVTQDARRLRHADSWQARCSTLEQKLAHAESQYADVVQRLEDAEAEVARLREQLREQRQTIVDLERTRDLPQNTHGGELQRREAAYREAVARRPTSRESKAAAGPPPPHAAVTSGVKREGREGPSGAELEAFIDDHVPLSRRRFEGPAHLVAPLAKGAIAGAGSGGGGGGGEALYHAVPSPLSGSQVRRVPPRRRTPRTPSATNADRIHEGLTAAPGATYVSATSSASVKLDSRESPAQVPSATTLSAALARQRPLVPAGPPHGVISPLPKTRSDAHPVAPAASLHSYPPSPNPVTGAAVRYPRGAGAAGGPPLSHLSSRSRTMSARRGQGRVVSAATTRSPSPVNPKRGADVPRRFVLTALSDAERAHVTAAIQRLGQRAVVLESDVEELPPFHTTHVVVKGTTPRSVKALCGLVSSKWIVSPEYVWNSVEAGFWLDELEEGSLRCFPPPLQHHRVLVSMEDGELKRRLEQVVEYGGAELVGRTAGSKLTVDQGVVVITSGDDLLRFATRTF